MLPGFLSIAGHNSRLLIEQTDSRTTADTTSSGTKTFNSVSFGNNSTGSFVLICAFHGDANVNPGTAPTCTMNGASSTRYEGHSTGDDSSGTDATGTSIFIGQPTADGNVVLTWGSSTSPATSIVVLRVTGYSTTPADTNGGSATAGDTDGSAAFNIPANGAVVGCSSSGQNNTARSWTNLTQRLEENWGGTNNRRSVAFDYNMTANASLTISTSPYSSSQGSNAWSIVVLTPA